MLEGAACVHMSSLVHRDIKPANLMLMDKNDFSTVKIADFGTTVGNVGYENLNQIAGTLGYEVCAVCIPSHIVWFTISAFPHRLQRC